MVYILLACYTYDTKRGIMTLETKARLLEIIKAEKLMCLRLELEELKRRMNAYAVFDYDQALRLEEDLEDGLFELEQELTVHRV